MAANVWPVDAVSGAPDYDGRSLRQTTGLLWTRNPARPLGAESGIVAGTPVTVATATSSTWTVTPFGGVIDGESSAVAGAYNFSFDSNQGGSVTAADASNPRLDLLYIRISDPAEGDGTAAPIIELLYDAGTPGASPALPSIPARSIPMWSILVPKVGGGSPTVSFIGSLAVAVGGVKPCANSAAYPASPHVGRIIYDQALKMALAWNGTAWVDTRGDTGWVNITPLAGFSSTGAQVRRVGTKVKARGKLVRGAGAFPAAATPCGTLPTGFDPSSDVQVPTAAFASSAANGMGILITSGSLSIQGYAVGGGQDTLLLSSLEFYTD